MFHLWGVTNFPTTPHAPPCLQTHTFDKPPPPPWGAYVFYGRPQSEEGSGLEKLMSSFMYDT